jgi:hypothetical protein
MACVLSWLAFALPVAAIEVGPPMGLEATTYAQVPALALLPGGRMVVGGDFDSLGGVRRRGIAALDAADAVDAGFDADCRPLVVSGVPRRCSIDRIVATDGGALIVSGVFSGFAGSLRAGLGKLDATTGVVDTLWNPAAPAGRPLAAIGGQVLLQSSLGIRSVDLGGRGEATPGFVPVPDTSLFAHNGRDTFYFARRDGASWRVRRADLATGAVDPDWRSREFGSITGLAYDPGSNDLLIAGRADAGFEGPFWLVRMDALDMPTDNLPWFAPLDGLLGMDSFVVRGGSLFARVRDRSGLSKVRRFPLGGSGTPDAAYASPYFSADLLGVDGAGRVLLNQPGAFGDDYFLPGGSTLRRLASDGAFEPGFLAPPRRDAALSHVSRASSGRMVLFGDDSRVNALRTRGLFRVAPEYSLDPAWAPHALFAGPFVSDTLTALAVDGAGRAYYSAVHFDDSGWVHPPAFARISDGGAVDASWNASGLLDEGLWSPGESVDALLLDEANGWLYVGGSFDGGICGAQRRYLARVSLSSPCSADPAWQPDLDAPVSALVMDALGRLYVGGKFEHVDGLSQAALVRFDGNVADATWRPLGTAPGRYAVAKLAVGEDHVFAALSFAPDGGVASEGLARFDAVSAASDTGWQPPPAVAIAGMLVTASGRLVVARRGVRSPPFYQQDDAVEVFDPAGSGTVASRLGLAPGQRIDALAQGRESDAVVVAGYFDQLGGQARRSIAELYLESRAIFQDGFD